MTVPARLKTERKRGAWRSASARSMRTPMPSIASDAGIERRRERRTRAEPRARRATRASFRRVRSDRSPPRARVRAGRDRATGSRRASSSARGTRQSSLRCQSCGFAHQTVVAVLGHQHVERETREIVGDGFDARVFLAIDDLAIAVTLLARLGPARPRCRRSLAPFARERLIADGLARGAAARAVDAYAMPFARAERAVQVAIALIRRLRVYDARDGQRSAQRADAGRVDREETLGVEEARHRGPVDLERRHHERAAGRSTRSARSASTASACASSHSGCASRRRCTSALTGAVWGASASKHFAQQRAPRSVAVTGRGQRRHAVCLGAFDRFGGRRRGRVFREHGLLCVAQDTR